MTKKLPNPDLETILMNSKAENLWIPAYAGMTPNGLKVNFHKVIPAYAGIQNIKF